MLVTALLLLVLALIMRSPAMVQIAERALAPAPMLTPADPAAGSVADAPGFLYGRVTTVDGAAYEGRLRWGGDQEAFWGDYFNGEKDGNPWAAYWPGATTAKPIEIFGIRIGRDRSAAPRRLFMA